jgi:hypothetical protein
MSEAKHTPGPWEIWYGGGTLDDYFTIGHTGGGNSTGVVCEYTPAAPRPNEELKANAHLIAAAPDLLAACRNFLALHDECDMWPEDECHKLRVMMDLARAKAEGKAVARG